MQVAEDTLLEKGWKISEVAGNTRHGHIKMHKVSAPPNKWRSVSWHILEPSRSWHYPRPNNERSIDFEINLSTNRLKRRGILRGNAVDARKSAAANAWAIAKAIKTLPLDTDLRTLANIVDGLLMTNVSIPEELF